MTKKEVRSIVKDVLKSELRNMPDDKDVKKIAQDEAEKAVKDVMTSKEVKDLIKKTMLKYHRWMWEKKGMWINQI